MDGSGERRAFFLASSLFSLQIPFCPERKFLARRRPSIRPSDSLGRDGRAAAAPQSGGRAEARREGGSGEDHFRQRFQNKPKKYAQASLDTVESSGERAGVEYRGSQMHEHTYLVDTMLKTGAREQSFAP